MSEITRRSAAGLTYLAREGAGIPPSLTLPRIARRKTRVNALMRGREGRGHVLPLVLLHGIGSNAQSFVSLMQALPHPTIAWDAPGYGGSQALAETSFDFWPDASDYAAALRRLLDELAIARCFLLGHSLGTLMAARFALTDRARVVHLVLASPALGNGTAKGQPLPPGVAARIEDLDRLGAAGFAASRAPKLVADPAGRPDVLASVERAMAAVRRPGYDQAARLLAGGDLIADAAQLDVPTMVLVGDADRVTPPANARRLHAVLRGGSHAYCEIAGAGHAVCQEQPDAVAAAIMDIVRSDTAAHA
ncbi:MAG: alpha/beta hydrolase [Proteobacteria bacterium]|nr:MAG: alpha/beta hydrolase [Pseudomonadota bacterium]